VTIDKLKKVEKDDLERSARASEHFGFDMRNRIPLRNFAHKAVEHVNWV
jgi:hypothetical protein